MRNCTDDEVSLLTKHVKPEIWRVNSLLAVNVMLVGVVVGIGAYAPRYRHHPLARFLFLGAAALFMPIVSSVVSATNNVASFVIGDDSHTEITLRGTCSMFRHTLCILLWTVFVQIAAINTTTVVAADARELGRSIAPSAFLLIHAIWTCYLVIYFLGTGYGRAKDFSLKTLLAKSHDPVAIFLLVPLCGLIFVKLVFKLGAFFMARQSFALGRNPRLVLGYMQSHAVDHVLAASSDDDDHAMPPPPLLIMGEDTVNVQKGPNSYTTSVNNNPINNLQQRAGLVTLDKVWQLMDEDDTNYSVTRRTQGQAGRLLKLKLKDACLSFALFKLLRCRFARYTADELKFTWVDNFFWQGLLLSTHDGGSSSSSRVFKVIADELSFIHDFYYSSIPILYSNTWLPILTFSISLFSLGYSLFVALFMTLAIASSDLSDSQLFCELPCKFQRDWTVWRSWTSEYYLGFGSVILFDLVPVLLLCVLLVLSEARDIASLFCSNWTKVVVICRYLRSKRRSWVGCLLLRCSCCKLVNNPWKDNINLCRSILLHHPRTKWSTPILYHHLLRRLLIPCLPLPEKTKSVKVPDQVKSAIIDKLKSSKGSLSLTKGTASLRHQSVLQGSDSLLWACSCGAEGSSTTDVLLVWHIATTILEVRRPRRTTTVSSTSDSSNSQGRIQIEITGRGRTHLLPFLTPLFFLLSLFFPLFFLLSLFFPVPSFLLSMVIRRGRPGDSSPPPPTPTTHTANSNRVVATHLSGYFAYLVACCPELLPDDDGWSKDLYKAVKEDAGRALAAGRAPLSTPEPEEEYEKLVRLLSAGCRHKVLRNGAQLAEQLLALVQTQTQNQQEEEDKVWEVLAEFWLEMILYVAPSDNLDGHAKAIARGGELITLLWALLNHAGIVTRPGTETASSSAV